MKNKHKYAVSIIIILFAFFLSNSFIIKGNTIKLSNKSLTIEIGTMKKLTVSGTKSKVSWASNNRSVATVSTSGTINAKSKGSATITAFVNGKPFTCKVTVIKPITINKATLSLYVGDTKSLKISGASNKITWSSSNKAIATVNSTGKVAAKKAGTVTIKASLSGKTLTCKVTVKKPVQSSKVEKTKLVSPTVIANLAPTPSPTPTPTPITKSPSKLEEASKSSNYKMIGYYAAWSKYSGFAPNNIDAGKLTHINYAFANIDSNYKIALGYPDIDEANIKSLNSLKVSNPKLKTLIAVGGWSWSDRFSDVALTEKNRNTFADSCVSFIVKYGFDGIDIDWEYPVSGGLSTNKKRPEDKTNFTLLLKTIREKLDARSKVDGNTYILSFAGAADAWYLKNIELDRIIKYVDYVNVMTYDLHGPWEAYTDHNAPLYSILNTRTNTLSNSVDSSINHWLQNGAPKDKLVMGVPFYGYIYKNVEDNNNGIFNTYRGGASITYDTVLSSYLNLPGYKKNFDNRTKVSWLFNGDTFISYEDTDSIKYKGEFVKAKGLAGAMIWELSQDKKGQLLGSLYSELK